ncbi:MAG: hypothetical protein NC402_07565 [Prevotella sp.]|nr:hypothetical protein [Prevotella sp.]MCM1075595.1 hypothetical protein [Ruminococcus sp.]
MKKSLKYVLALAAVMMCVQLSACGSSSHHNDDEDDDEDYENVEKSSRHDDKDKEDGIIGDWYAEIYIPQNDLAIELEFNFNENKECEVKATWTKNSSSETERGRAEYSLRGNRLSIDFLNEDELITKDNVFSMHNTYDIELDGDRMTILNSPEFRNQDIQFGRGAENIGRNNITF